MSEQCGFRVGDHVVFRPIGWELGKLPLEYGWTLVDGAEYTVAEVYGQTIALAGYQELIGGGKVPRSMFLDPKNPLAGQTHLKSEGNPRAVVAYYHPHKRSYAAWAARLPEQTAIGASAGGKTIQQVSWNAATLAIELDGGLILHCTAGDGEVVLKHSTGAIDPIDQRDVLLNIGRRIEMWSPASAAAKCLGKVIQSVSVGKGGCTFWLIDSSPLQCKALNAGPSRDPFLVWSVE